MHRKIPKDKPAKEKVSLREALLTKISPERRATYERIRRLREEIGPGDFDVGEAIREFRENG